MSRPNSTYLLTAWSLNTLFSVSCNRVESLSKLIICTIFTQKHPVCSLSWLTGGHLLLLSSHGSGVRLLLKETPGLVSLSLKVLHVGNKLDGVDNAVVIEQHASDLTSGLSVLLLDDTVDVVSDLLASLSWVLHGL